MITYDKKSWKINNERIFILSAAIHYFRLPRAEWEEVLDKAKAGGCNTIETYIPWNFHEMNEGEWDFSDDKDLAYFLQLCADRDLYVIARPGPYICAEWDFGGLPWWLSTKEGIQYRTMEPTFIKHVDQYFDQVIPIIEEKQLTKNGSVIMVQVENEFQAYGFPDTKYMEYLRDGMIERGIDVPLVTCYGAVDGAVEFRNFWSHAEHAGAILDERFADQPKGVMEFWIGWFEQWGGNKANQKTPEHLERECYQLLSSGFTAINYYMYFGGTNFDHWGGRTYGEQTFSTTSYDYDVAIDEYLQTTKKYDVLKRYHSFAKWLEPVLTNAESASHELKLPSDVKANRIVSEHGEILFIENTRNERTQSRLYDEQHALPYTIEANAILPVVRNVKISDDFTIKTLTGQTTGFGKDKGIIYQQCGQRSSLLVELYKEAVIECPLPNRVEVLEDGKQLFHFFHGDEPQTVRFQFTDGSSYLLEIIGKHLVETSVPKLEKTHTHSQLQWEAANENLQFAQGSVKESEQPLDFSEFGQFSGYLGYESEFSSDEETTKTIVFPRIEDPVAVYCNDQFVGKISQLGASIIDVPVIKGNNKLTCLVQNMGRFNYTSALGEPKGISSAPSVGGRHISLVADWQVEGAGRKHQLGQIPKIEGRIAFLRNFINAGFDRAVLVGEGVSRITVNGQPGKKLIEGATGWSRNSAVYGVADISDALLSGENRLDLDAQHLSSIGRLDVYLYNESERVLQWKMKSCAQVQEQKDWRALSAVDQKAIFPRWYRSEFSWDPSNGSVVKVRLNQMSKGCFWVNGECLGRYWNIGPQEDYKIPASLLKEQNEIIIFDEDGHVPEQVAIHSYTPVAEEDNVQGSLVYHLN